MRTTRSMTESAARNAVLNTTELLEAILVCLPFKQLLVLQRVGRHFQEVINTSTQLQQRMFLKPSQKEEYWTLQQKRPVELDEYGALKCEVVPTSENNIGKIQTFQAGTLCPLMTTEAILRMWPTSKPSLRNRDHGATYYSLTRHAKAPCGSASRKVTSKADESGSVWNNTPASISGRTLGDLFDTIASVRFEQEYIFRKNSGVKMLDQDGTISEILQILGATESAANAIKHFRIDVTFPMIFATDADYQKMRQEGRIV